jgi:hypothetical protein
MDAISKVEVVQWWPANLTGPAGRCVDVMSSGTSARQPPAANVVPSELASRSLITQDASMMLTRHYIVPLCVALLLLCAGCASNSEGQAASPASTAAESSECTEFELRGALDARGERPLLDVDPFVATEYFYDEFELHQCQNDWALVEASRSSSSSFDFWLLKHGDDSWTVVGVSGVRADTPDEVSLFSGSILEGLGVDVAAATTALGTTTTLTGRPIFEP